MIEAFLLLNRWVPVVEGGSNYLEIAEEERMTTFTEKELHRAAFWSAIFRQILAFSPHEISPPFWSAIIIHILAFSPRKI
jgi:hypothetical protein